jgi:hypothetical protein
MIGIIQLGCVNGGHCYGVTCFTHPPRYVPFNPTVRACKAGARELKYEITTPTTLHGVCEGCITWKAQNAIGMGHFVYVGHDLAAATVDGRVYIRRTIQLCLKSNTRPRVLLPVRVKWLHIPIGSLVGLMCRECGPTLATLKPPRPHFLSILTLRARHLYPGATQMLRSMIT